AYAGWQVQPGQATIQLIVEDAIEKVFHQEIRVHASGRTDAGVHARQQVAHFDLRGLSMPTSRMLVALNAVLPADIRVIRIRGVGPDFHARLSATAKEYRYYLWCGPVLPPFLYRYRWHVRRKLDIPRMQCAARYLIGRHDFTSFSANPNRPLGDTRRHLQLLVIRKKGYTIEIVARADGFLYRMMRSLVGFLVRVGEGELAPSAARDILRAKRRTAAVPTAPAQGLFLWKVFY
ncbi:MAG TPA: tRNA pseudouridine(38-40) synthase TruA, partial [Lentisphaerae bacterium]|nr:tRNA pseudouridine(38-40) synthase TruA [Lentisphaerota bacterium]